MKRIKYLLVAVLICLFGLVNVNAAELLPYEEGITAIVLTTYDGVYKTTKVTQNYSKMKDVLTVLSDKTMPEQQDGVGGLNLTTLDFYYSDVKKVTVTFYGENVVGITEGEEEQKIYDLNYDGNARQKIIELYSDIIVGEEGGKGDVSNPETGDNTIAIIIGGIAAVSLAVVSYRKRNA